MLEYQWSTGVLIAVIPTHISPDIWNWVKLKQEKFLNFHVKCLDIFCGAWIVIIWYNSLEIFSITVILLLHTFLGNYIVLEKCSNNDVEWHKVCTRYKFCLNPAFCLSVISVLWSDVIYLGWCLYHFYTPFVKIWFIFLHLSVSWSMLQANSNRYFMTDFKLGILYQIKVDDLLLIWKWGTSDRWNAVHSVSWKHLPPILQS